MTADISWVPSQPLCPSILHTCTGNSEQQLSNCLWVSPDISVIGYEQHCEKWMQWTGRELASFRVHHTQPGLIQVGRVLLMWATSNRVWKVKPQKEFIYRTSLLFHFPLFFPLEATPCQRSGDALLSQRRLQEVLFFSVSWIDQFQLIP